MGEGGLGKHTRDILGGRGGVAAGEGGGEGEEGGIRFGRKAGGGGGGKGQALLSNTDLATLRATIQRLATASVPLGKAMDYVAQDSEDMRGEASAWKVECARQSEALEREVRETGEVLTPLVRALCEKEEAIRDVARRILAVKATVARNDARVLDIVRMATQH